MKNYRLFVPLLIGLITYATAAGAVNLTGTWTGKESCTYTAFATTQRFKSETFSMNITQAGIDLNAEGSGGLLNLRYNGTAFDHPKNSDKGNGFLNFCNNTPTASAVSSFKVTMKPAENTGTLKLLVLGTDPVHSYNCKYTLKRTSAVDPLVSGAACP